MASVFLSYDHDDHARAAPIAAALEKAGHNVWWDKQIAAGAEYNSEIEDAVDRADAVIVLWSERSVRSAWVRDEAAEGRDRGKLVPVTIDGAKPPMGFRQYQTLDLSNRKGAGGLRQMDELMRVIGNIAPSDGLPSAPPSVRAPASGWHRSKLAWPVVAALAALMIGGSLLAWRAFDRRSVPVVAVVPAANSAPAKAMARDLLIKLGSLRAAKTDGMRLVGPGSSRADFIFEVSDSAPSLDANLALFAGKDRAVLWSSDFEQQAGSAADLKQRTAFTAARVLGCALEGLSAEHEQLSQNVLKLYLNACAQLDETFFHDASQVIPILERVTVEAPKFEPAWAKLLVAETNHYQNMSSAEHRAYAPKLRRTIAAARHVDPDIPEAYVAEIELLPGGTFYEQVRLIDRAAQLGPDNVFVLAGRSLAMLCVGRLEEAVEDARRAASLDPLSPAIRSSYIQALINSGKTDTARAELAKADHLWPGAPTILDSKVRLILAYGNLAEAADALRLMHSGAVPTGPAPREAFVQARLDRTPSKIDRTVKLATSAYRARPEISTASALILTLGEFDRTEELLKFLSEFNDTDQLPYFVELLFVPPLADLRADRRFMSVAARFGLVNYWRRSGDWPDFCSDPDLPYNCKAEAAKLAS